MTRQLIVGARGQFTTLVDDEDYDFLIRWPWTFARSHPYGRRELVYARRTVLIEGDLFWSPDGPVPGPKRKFDLFVHHVVLARMGYPEPPEPGWTADHENTDTLDNRRANLRWASLVFQGRNRNSNTIDGKHSEHLRQALAVLAPTHTWPAIALASQGSAP